MIVDDVLLIDEALLRDARLDDLAVQIRRRVALDERTARECPCELCQARRAGMPRGWPREGGDDE